MAKPIIVMTGQKELDRAINSLPIENKTRKRVIVQAARESLKSRILKQARSKTPKRTGLLQKNIKVKSITRSRGFIGAKVSAGMPTKGENSGKAFYGAFLLWGTKPRTTKSGANRGAIKANPWLYTVVARRRNITMKDYSRRIKKNIIKAAQGKKI